MPQRSASYRISGVKLDRTDDDVWIVKPATPAWFLSMVGASVLVLIGVALLSAGSSGLLLSLLLFVSALAFLITYPLAAKVRLDFAARELNFTATYLLRLSRRTDWSVPFGQIARLDLLPRPFGKSHVVRLQLQDGAELVMDFGRRVAEAEQFVQRLASATGSAGPSAGSHIPTPSQGEATLIQARLQREIRSWASWLIVMGLLQMAAARGLSPWGIVLLIVGAASFYFREAPMFVVYAVTVGWAGMSNLLSDTTVLWKGFAIFQAVMVYSLFRQYRYFRRAEKIAASTAPVPLLDTAAAPAPTRTERWFPWFTLLLGGVALLLFIAALACAFILRNRDLIPLINLLETLAVNMAVLGLATGLASLLSITSNKWVSIVGCLASGLTLLAELAIPVLLRALA
jgi:hypothetical protein